MDMVTGVYIDMCMDMCINMCIDMYMDMCMDMCHTCVQALCTHVLRH